MNREEVVMMALASANGASHSPVQVQKLLFLIDREISQLVNGPYFNFRPYNYGPFDKAVYKTLEILASKGYVDVVVENNWRNYKLTAIGQERGNRLLNTIPAKARDYIYRISEFVRRLSFTELVSAIYKAYPEMRENSVFKDK